MKRLSRHEKMMLSRIGESAGYRPDYEGYATTSDSMIIPTDKTPHWAKPFTANLVDVAKSLEAKGFVTTAPFPVYREELDKNKLTVTFTQEGADHYNDIEYAVVETYPSRCQCCSRKPPMMDYIKWWFRNVRDFGLT